jgi:hypothetical protein
MPSPIPVLCSMPRAQKDTLGCEDSSMVKHCANHVTYHRHLIPKSRPGTRDDLTNVDV